MQSESVALPEGLLRLGLVPLHPAGDPRGDQPLMRHLADVLPSHGVAVLTYDRRPAADGRDVPLADQAEDARVAMVRLREATGQPDLPIGLWGLSQGAWAAMLAAASGAAAFLVCVSGSGVSPAEQMRYGTRRHLLEAGHDERALGELDELRAAYEGYLRGDRSRAEVQRLVDAGATQPWFELAWVPRELPEPGSWPDMDYDPVEALGRIRCPMLAVFGEDDEWVPVDRSIERLRLASRQAGFGMTVARVPGTGHEPVLTDSGAVSPVYEEILTGWVSVGGR